MGNNPEICRKSNILEEPPSELLGLGTTAKCNDKPFEQISSQQKIIDQNLDKLNLLEDKCAKLDTLRKEFEVKFEYANKQKDVAIKEKENMVIR